MKAWDVYLAGRKIETVFFTPDITHSEVYKSLINHDGYNPDIEVRTFPQDDEGDQECIH